MNLLVLDQRHPSILTIVGTASGASAWIGAHSLQITGVCGMIGAICSMVLALSALVTKLVCAAIAVRERRRARAWRKQMNRMEPHEDMLP